MLDRFALAALLFAGTLIGAGCPKAPVPQASVQGGEHGTLALQELDAPAAEGSRVPWLTVGRDGDTYLSWVERDPDTDEEVFRFARYG
jgi:hypothetical protein